jgi:hypothetical protein
VGISARYTCPRSSLCRPGSEVEEEPPCSPGLGKLTAPLGAFVDFLRIDIDGPSYRQHLAHQSKDTSSGGRIMTAKVHRWLKLPLPPLDGPNAALILDLGDLNRGGGQRGSLGRLSAGRIAELEGHCP